MPERSHLGEAAETLPRAKSARGHCAEEPGSLEQTRLYKRKKKLKKKYKILDTVKRVEKIKEQR